MFRMQVLTNGDKVVGVDSNIDPLPGTKIIDGQGMYLAPGFIDIHVHGGGGFSVMSGLDAVIGMANAHAAFGTTSLLPTTLAAPIPQLISTIQDVRAAKGKSNANILGVHLEGPFLAQSQRGAQSEDSLLAPTKELVESLLDVWDGILMMGAAPEIDGGFELGQTLAKRGIVASVAHSDATYDEIIRAIECGYSDVTHIYSGCSGMIRKNGYRIPGVIEAGLLRDELTVQMIADLKHLPVPLIQLIYKNKGPGKISMITDGLEFSASNIKEGNTYVQKNGVTTIFEDGVMKLENREGFAGSVATMRDLVYNVVKEAGVPLIDAVRMATLTPASVVGVSHHKGIIAPGYDADIILFDDSINIQMCMVGGKILSTRL